MRLSDEQILAGLTHTVQSWFPEEYARKFSTAERMKLAKEGKAMADGSFPVVTTEDLKNAIGLARTPAQRTHIKKQAARLSASKSIPETWAHLGGATVSIEAAAAAGAGVCPTCKGTGKIEGGTMVGMMKCPTCKGTGKA